MLPTPEDVAALVERLLAATGAASTATHAELLNLCHQAATTLQSLAAEVRRLKDECSRWAIRMADIREAAGVGHTPMLTELPDAIRKRIAGLVAERDEVLRRKEHTEYWYAVRLEHLKDTAKREGIWDEVAAIIANGSATRTLPDGTVQYDPPTYAQQLNRAIHRAEAAEALLAEVESSLVDMVRVYGLGTPASRALMTFHEHFRAIRSKVKFWDRGTWRSRPAEALIDALRAEEGDSVTLLCDNPEGPPNNAIECCGAWTDWTNRRFTGDTIHSALLSAYRTRHPTPDTTGGAG